jgi:hypothetical protein
MDAIREIPPIHRQTQQQLMGKPATAKQIEQLIRNILYNLPFPR